MDMDLDLTISESENLHLDLEVEDLDLNLDLRLWDLTTSLISVYHATFYKFLHYNDKKANKRYHGMFPNYIYFMNYVQ